jgi:hypothetical protein
VLHVVGLSEALGGVNIASTRYKTVMK